MEIWNKTYLKEKISKLNIYAIITFTLPFLVFGSLFLKNLEKEKIPIKYERPRAELRSVDSNGNFYTYSYPVIDSPADYLIIKNKPSRYQNLEGVIAEHYPKIKPYIHMIEKSIEEHKSIFHLDPLIVSILMNAESGGDPNAVSGAGAVGLMQLMLETAEEMGLKAYRGNWDIYQALKEARKNIRETYILVIDALKRGYHGELVGLSKKYNFYVNEAGLLYQEYKRTLVENKDLEERFDPEKNIWAGVKYLAILARLNMDNRNIASLRSIIAAYNFRGEDAAKEWILPTIDEPIKHANIIIDAFRITKPLAMKSPVIYVE